MSADTSYHYHAEGDAAGKTLVFAFHGTGGDERQFLPVIHEVLPGAAIVAPRGDVSERGALRFFKRRAEGVYDMDDLARATDKMGAFVRERIAEGKPARVLGIGYSNGANILASVVLSHPGLFDEAVLMHPLIPWTPEPVSVGTRVLITAGERDPIAPAEDTRRLAEWFRQSGSAVALHWHNGGHELARSEIDAFAEFAGVLERSA